LRDTKSRVPIPDRMVIYCLKEQAYVRLADGARLLRQVNRVLATPTVPRNVVLPVPQRTPAAKAPDAPRPKITVAFVSRTPTVNGTVVVGIRLTAGNLSREICVEEAEDLPRNLNSIAPDTVRAAMAGGPLTITALLRAIGLTVLSVGTAERRL